MIRTKEGLLARPIAMRLALAVLVSLAAAGAAQAGSSNVVEKGKSKGGAPSSHAAAPATQGNAPRPTAKVAGSYGSWTLLCGKEGNDKAAKERCSLVMPLVEKESQKLVFRVIVTYGPRNNLVLRVDSPTGIALQRGLEFSPDTQKTYRMAFQTCLPMGCKALLLMPDDLKKELIASKEGAITVYALNGKAVRTVTPFTGFAKGLAALDKHHASQ
jgi:invasion protein IalB